MVVRSGDGYTRLLTGFCLEMLYPKSSQCGVCSPSILALISQNIFMHYCSYNFYEPVSSSVLVLSFR